MKFFLLICATLSLVGCSSVQVRHEEAKADETVSTVPSALAPAPTIEQTNLLSPLLNDPTVVVMPPAEVPAVVPPPAPAVDENGNPKHVVGVILGPGGLRAYAHVGVLQEFAKAKIPVSQIVGLEFSSIVAAAYAVKTQIFDVEWQMLKLHEEDFFNHGLLSSGGSQDPEALNHFLEAIFGKGRIEEAKAGFGCPSFQTSKRKTVILNQGLYSEVLPSCFPYTPFFKSNKGEIAGVTALQMAAQYLKSKGVNYVVYVDLLGDKSNPMFKSSDSENNAIWSSIAENLDSQMHEVNKIISVPVGSFSLNDFTHRREMIQRGQESGHASVIEIQTELGL